MQVKRPVITMANMFRAVAVLRITVRLPSRDCLKKQIASKLRTRDGKPKHAQRGAGVWNTSVLRRSFREMDPVDGCAVRSHFAAIGRYASTLYQNLKKESRNNELRRTRRFSKNGHPKTKTRSCAPGPASHLRCFTSMRRDGAA
ncbi:hypothetical protein D3C86_1863220 [compost metagenome]